MNGNCFYSAQGQFLCNKLQTKPSSLIENFYAGPVVKQTIPEGDYKKTCTGCGAASCTNNKPKKCTLTCTGCAVDTSKPITNINNYCTIKGNCKRSQYVDYKADIDEITNFNGQLMKPDEAVTAKAIQDVAIKRALEAAAPAQPDATQTQTQTVAVAQPAQSQAVAVAKPAQAQTVAAQPAQAQPAQTVAAQPTIQDLQQQLISLQQQITQATATGNTTTVASTAEQFKNNYGSYSYSPFKYEYAKF
jgi:hypothetical protein